MLYWYPFHAPSKNTESLFTIVNTPSFHDKTPKPPPPRPPPFSGADPEFFLGGDALVSCSTSTPINHIVFFFAEYQLY